MIWQEKIKISDKIMKTNIGLYIIIFNTYRFLIDNNYKTL